MYQAFLSKLAAFRILDPACGSGNFLYLALQSLKNIEHRAMLEAEQLGLQREFGEFNVGVQCVTGIELNSYAAELARMTVWIGDISWSIRHGVQPSKEPILKNLERIECRDALLNDDGAEAEWPKVDAIVGNPPFLGNKKMKEGLGADYVHALRLRFNGRVPGGADLVTYWFEKARAQIESGAARAAGLVGTNSIRGGANRKVLERILANQTIFDAWSDQEWVNEGAAVRVSLVCFGKQAQVPRLDGQQVKRIHADLTAELLQGGGADLTVAHQLKENAGISFQGPVLIGPFEIKGEVAREWLLEPNPNGRPNSDVLRPISNGRDITSRSRGLWVVDFGLMPQQEASMYTLPFEYVRKHVMPIRSKNPRINRRERWWVHGETGSGWRHLTTGLSRYLATSQVSKHRFFVWLPERTWPHQTVISVGRSDDEMFGILNSRFHTLWALRLGTNLEDRPRYTPTTTFDTFPFPGGITPDLDPKSHPTPITRAIGWGRRQARRSA